MLRSLLALLPALLALSCAHGLSSEERLERELRTQDVLETPEAAEIKKLHCLDTSGQLGRVTTENKSEGERLKAYTELYASVKQRLDTIEGAMAKNPDLRYREGSQELILIRDGCQQQLDDVRVEFERYVREVSDVPTVQEIKGGKAHTIARVDFDILRQAIETLNPDDKESLLSQVESAERKVEVKEGAKADPKKKR